MHRRHLLLGAGALALPFALGAQKAKAAANPAEDFISGNIQTGFDILNDHSLDAAERGRRFASFLLGLTDMRRVAVFLLGQYAPSASPADLDAYVAAYQDYVLSVYQSYFARYAGQSLHVRASHERAPGDFIVNTDMTGGSQPMQIDFRVRTDGAKPVLVDFAVEGVWLALAERDQFVSVLAQNNGDVKALTAHLRALQQR
ncbi:MAG TPA: ABC transporter substrate-binding protein [Rhizomicrobium sp.]|jgi:phospholipid transport system substrate-binding protein|nr:ABC transporter substrate-binding protein [Rhizomicrobium sp.]